MAKGVEMVWYPRARALPGHALSGRLCLQPLLRRQSRSAPAFPGGAWEREDPRNKSRESQHEKKLMAES
jgi:hypothetical protein